MEACPELGTPAIPVRPCNNGRPDAAFRLINGVGIATSRISELNLHGLLPRCVRFSPTSRPVNGNTRYGPACSLWPGRTYTRWIPFRGFTVSSSVPPLPRFSQRDNEVGRCKSFFLGCWPPGDTPVAYLLKINDHWRCCVHPYARLCVASSLRCCAPTISSVIADHDDFCELPSIEGRRVA